MATIWHDEFIKLIFNCLGGIFVLFLGALGGQRLTAYWNLRQKRRELQLSALQQFYGAYGDFFAVWKLWNRLDRESKDAPERTWELHKRAASAEAIVESTMVRLASEMKLLDFDIRDLGRFRQAFQQLRQSIRKNQDLEWPSSECPEYKSFKTLAVHCARIISKAWPDRPIAADLATTQLLQITSNKWEHDWIVVRDH
ncbi:hypothetical protein [Terracidiphilus gabretensis]|jgi:hypothetical protein|uniref:hypothetical protein n=1 Tax=Terracidiphilus gabretensis TaxID=1577687 RepID=UPI00071B7E75|nr:hypothetical protein [Terracidiphilus gabretensis]